MNYYNKGVSMRLIKLKLFKVRAYVGTSWMPLRLAELIILLRHLQLMKLEGERKLMGV